MERAVWHRLFVAAVLVAAVSLACWYILPAAGADVPWFVPALAFGVIFVAVFMRSTDEAMGDEGDDGADADTPAPPPRPEPPDPDDNGPYKFKP